MDDPGFEGVGDFSSDDPWQRYIAHQAAKGNYPRESTGGVLSDPPNGGTQEYPEDVPASPEASEGRGEGV